MSTKELNQVTIIGELAYKEPKMFSGFAKTKIQSIPIMVKVALTDVNGKKGKVQEHVTVGGLNVQWSGLNLIQRIELLQLFKHYYGQPVELTVYRNGEWTDSQGMVRDNWEVVCPDGNLYASIREATTTSPIDATYLGEHNIA